MSCAKASCRRSIFVGRWVSYLRSRREKLSIEQILILDEIGFIWDVLDDQWEQGFESLKKFREREGHCIVNGKHFENYFSLGQWVSDQRRKKFITEDRIKRLNSIDFVWDILGAKWEEGFNSLVKFKMREGHCRVTRFHIEDGIQLGIWVRTQRKNKFSMSNDRIKRLDNLGFIWNVYKKT